MNCIFIYNPVSGRGKISKKLPYIEKTLKEKYDVVDVYATKGPGDTVVIAKSAVEKYDAIVFAGGDGTFNEILHGIADSDKQPELGYIPTGTVNDIAHTLKLPRNVKKALKIVVNGKNDLLDCMKVNDHYAMYVIAAGAFTSATYTTAQLQKNQIGRVAYWLEGVKHNLNFDVFDIHCEQDGNKKQTGGLLISIINSRYVAGFRLNRLASLQDGKIELIVVKQKRNSNFFQKVASFFALAKLFLFGYRSNDKNFLKMEGTKFDISVDDTVVWNFDGERGITGNIHVEVIPKKVNMLVSQKLKKI